jgi:RND family efflux transporter MFP subunit
MKLAKRTWGLISLVLASLLFMLWLADLLHFDKIAPGHQPLTAAPPKGRELVVREQEIPQELTVLAQVMSPSLTLVAPQVSGRVTRLYAEAGSRVAKGAPLAELSARELQMKVSQARAGAAQAQAHLAQVGADYRRYQRLLKEGAVSPREFEALEAKYKAAQAQVAQAQAQVQETATLAGYTQVTAPRDGVVAERRAAIGDMVQPGHPLFTLYDPRDLKVEGEVNDAYRPCLATGMQVEVTIPALNYTGKTTLAEIFPLSASQSRTFKVRTERLKVPGLIPGMFARLTLSLGPVRGLLIPKAAVREIGQLTLVEVMVEGRSTSRMVQLGRQVGDQVEVLSGLQAGERLVLP